MGVIKIIGTPLYQWELGRKISISTSEHTIINKVEFSHDGDTESLVVKPRVENDQMVADIPNIMLLSGHYIHVYISYSDENLLETVAYDILPVMKRPKPSDYVYTETEVESYAELEARVAELEKVGGLDPETIEKAIAEYMTENPLDTKPIKGVDYFTPEEVQEIAEQAAQMVEVPDSGDYELPIANPETLGGVKPVAKGADMTKEVGVDELGGLWTAPGGADGWDVHGYFNMPEVLDSGFEITEIDGKPLKLKEVWAIVKLQNGSTSSQWLGCSILNDANEVLTGTGASNGGIDTASGGYAYFTYHGFVVGNGRAFVECTINKTVNNGGGGALQRHTNRAWLNNWHGYYEISYFKGIKCDNNLGSGTPQGRGTEVEIWGRSV